MFDVIIKKNKREILYDRDMGKNDMGHIRPVMESCSVSNKENKVSVLGGKDGEPFSE